MTHLLVGGERFSVIGHDHCLIESRSRPGQYHALELVDEGRGFLEEACTCEGFEYRRSCHHSQLVRLWRLGLVSAQLDLETPDSAAAW